MNASRFQQIFAAALLMSVAAFCHAAPAATVLTPEQAADLYLRTFVNRDLDAARVLNDYLKPAYDNQNALDLEALAKFAADKPAQDRAQVQEIVAAAPEANRAVLAEASLNYFQGLDHAIVGAACRATGSEIRPNETTRAMGGDKNKNDVIATVTYRCEIPQIDEPLQQEIAVAMKAEDVAAMRVATGKLKQALLRPASTRTVVGKQDLYRHTGNSVWLSGAFDEWVDPVLEGLPSLQPSSATEQ
ncbi:MAG TPA: hypothetical protein VF471_04550 [Pseudoxanthomonas sp.]